MAQDPVPADPNNVPQPWQPPTSDQEFEFTDIQSAPAWVDRGWAGFDSGPALAVPMSDLWGEGPYHTQSAKPGDIVRFVAATPSKAAHMEIIKREPTGDEACKKPPQQSPCSLEDALKGGYLSVEDLGAEGRAQVAARSPRLAKVIEEGGGTQLAEPVTVSDYVKTT